MILSGGLGPTEDDVTREAVAQALGRKLVFHPAIAEALERRFAAMQRKMSEINKRQAFVIDGAEVLPNDRGTAPGQWVDESGAVAMLLPGPPHELKAMFERQCLPRLARIVPQQAIRTAFLRVTGMPESDLDALISPVYKKYREPRDHHSGGQWRLAGPPARPLRHRSRSGRAAGRSGRRRSTAAGRPALLAQRRSAGSSGGRPAAPARTPPSRWPKAAPAACWASGLPPTPGSSDYFVGGFITYSNEMKVELLGVSAETLERFGAVSRETAEAMAAGARQRTGATYAVSITGVAGPDGGTEEKPVGLVHIGIAGPEGVASAHRRFLGDRQRIRVFTTQMALDLLRRKLQGLP